MPIRILNNMLKQIITLIILVTIVFPGPLRGSMDGMLDSTLSRSLSQMESLYASGKWDAAMELGRGIIKDAPKNHPVSNRAQDIIILSIDGKNREVLMNNKREATRKQQEASQSLAAEGNKLLVEKNYKGAAEKLLASVKLNSGDAQTYFLLGYSFLKAGDKKQAYNAFSRCLAINPGHSRALFHIAGLSYEIEKGEEAEKYTAQLIKIIEAKLAEYKSVFQSQRKGRLNDKAVETARKMTSLKSNLAQAAYMNGMLAQKRKDYKAAAKAFEKVAKLQPNSAEAWYRLGINHMQNKLYHQATLALEQAVFIRESSLKELSGDAKRLLDEGLTDEAVEAEIKTRKIKEQMANSLYMLAVANGRKKESTAALRNIEKALDIKPDFIQGKYTKAVLLAENSLLDEALEEMRDVLKQCAPNSKEARKSIQMITSLMNQIAKRDNPVDMAIASRPKKSQEVNEYVKDMPGLGGKVSETALEEIFPKLREIKKLVDMRNFAEASRRLIYLRSRHPEIADLHAILAHCYSEMGRYSEAEKSYKQALGLQPSHSEAMNGIAYIWANRGDNLDKALEYSEAAVKAEGMRAEFWHTHGWVLFKKGEVRKSVESFKKALGIKPNYMIARYNLGLAFYLVKGYGAAIDAFEAVLALNPSHQKALLFKAICLAKAQKPDDALASLKVLEKTLDEKSTLAKVVKDFEKKIKDALVKNIEIPVPEIKSPVKIDRLLAEARDYRSKNLVTRAKAIYLECQRLSPDSYEPYYELGEMYAESGLHKAALVSWEKASELKPDNFDVLMNMGKMQHKIGQFAKARESFGKAMKVNSKNAEPVYYLGMLAYEEKNFETAKVFASDAIKLKPNYFKAMALLGMTQVRLDNLKEAKSTYEKLYAKAPSDSSIKRHARTKIWEIARALTPEKYPSYENAMAVKTEMTNKAAMVKEAADGPKIQIAISPSEEELVAKYGKNTMTPDDKEWVLRQFERFGAVKNPSLSGTLRKEITPQTLTSNEKQWVVNKLQSFGVQKNKYSLPQEVSDDKYSVKALEEVVIKLPDKSDEMTKKAIESMTKGFVAQATEEFKKAKEISPTNLNVLTNLGFVNTLSGNFKDAFEAYAQAAVSNPESNLAKLGLGNLYWLGGQADKAIEQWSLLKDEYKLDEELNILKKTEQVWKRMLEIDPLDVDAHSNLGIVYMFSGEPTKALAEFQAVNNLENNRVEHDYYRAQMYVLLFTKTKNKSHRKEAEKILDGIAKNTEIFPHSERLKKFVASL